MRPLHLSGSHLFGPWGRHSGRVRQGVDRLIVDLSVLCAKNGHLKGEGFWRDCSIAPNQFLTISRGSLPTGGLMSLNKVLKLLILGLLAGVTVGCGSSNTVDSNFPNQSFQNFDAPVQLRFTAVPNRVSGGSFGPVSVSIRDSNGIIVTTATNPVTITLNNPGGAVLSGTTTVDAIAGVATFNDLSVNLAGDYSFTATSTGLLPANSNDFSITAGQPTSATFLTQPPPLPAPGTLPTAATSVTKGQPLPPLVVELRDASGNLVATNSQVSMRIAVDPTGTATLGGTTSVLAVNGVATFNNLTVETGGGVLVLAATSGAGAVAVSNPFFVVADLFAYAASLPGVLAPLSADSGLFRADALASPITPAPVGAITGVKNVTGLVALRDGRLLGTNRDNPLIPRYFAISNPDTNAAPDFITDITGINGGTTLTGLTYDGQNNIIYIYVADGTSPGLYTLNSATGAATFIGASGLTGTGVGLGLDPFQNPRVIYTRRTDDNSLVTLSPSTGVGTPVPTSVGNVSPDLTALVVNPFNTALQGLIRPASPFAYTLNVIDKATGIDSSPVSLPFITAGTFRVEE